MGEGEGGTGCIISAFPAGPGGRCLKQLSRGALASEHRLGWLRYLACFVPHLSIPSLISIAPAVKVQPLGEESSWNVDGELMTNNSVSIAVQRGLVDVFARGVELVAPLS